MTRLTSLALISIATIALAINSIAGPLDKAKEAANTARDQMEEAAADPHAGHGHADHAATETDIATETAPDADSEIDSEVDADASADANADADVEADTELAPETPADDAVEVKDDDAHAAPAVTRAIAIMMPTEGETVRGSVVFTETETGVRVSATITGLHANTTHGFHIHQFGDVSKPNGKGTGGHFNPDGHDHALMDPTAGHTGDLGNLKSDEDGTATYRETFEGLTLYTGPHAIMGRGVIIHADPDDGGQPTGNAGARVSQGVIGVAGPALTLEKLLVE
ncbi:MAG: superoxide dismutase family protein [Algisphaera sp.]